MTGKKTHSTLAALIGVLVDLCLCSVNKQDHLVTPSTVLNARQEDLHSGLAASASVDREVILTPLGPLEMNGSSYLPPDLAYAQSISLNPLTTSAQGS